MVLCLLISTSFHFSELVIEAGYEPMMGDMLLGVFTVLGRVVFTVLGRVELWYDLARG